MRNLLMTRFDEFAWSWEILAAFESVSFCYIIGIYRLCKSK
ncbi:CLUMA_CG015820, isoform A [Clunio marinus]|uniref:CLUMA_CG015820, isoform A n=1 Tax=Clunio marinus TaxID=568069 RepID=A0A1J1IWH3_9DIPT|nr:CLUMA_CG015820, isoform A [Clunio marinus]